MRLTLKEKQKIVEAIHHAEKETSGQIRTHISYLTEEKDIILAAKSTFIALAMHQTEEHNGILLYLNPVIKKFAIFGDDGIHKKVGQDFWEDLSKQISAAIKEKNIAHGIVHAVEKMGHALKTYFPADQKNTEKKNELSDDVSESE